MRTRASGQAGRSRGVERHGNLLRKKITLDGRRQYVTHLPGYLQPFHEQELFDYCEALRAAEKAGDVLPPPPWLSERGRFPVRPDMTVREFVDDVVLPTWESLERLTLDTKNDLRRTVHLVMHAFRRNEVNWSKGRVGRVRYSDIEPWLLARFDELERAAAAKRDGEPLPVLPTRAEYDAVRAWARSLEDPLFVSEDRRAPVAHFVLELYREAHQPDASVPAAPLVLNAKMLEECVLVIKRIFKEAQKYHDTFGLDANPAEALEVPEFSRTSSLRHRRRQRLPAGPQDFARIASLLHPSFRLALWLGVILALRVGEIFGLAVIDWNPVAGTVSVRRQFGAWRTRRGAPLRYLKNWPKTDISAADVPVGVTLAVHLTAEIERTYGHSIERNDDGSFKDSWWYEQVPEAERFDRMIVRNCDRPICVSPAGLTAHRTIATAFWNQLRDAARATGLDLRQISVERAGPLRSHDLRKSISAHLHEMLRKHRISDAVRCAYLRHELQANQETAATTAHHYTATIEEDLVRLAQILDQEWVPLLGPLAAPGEATGVDRLVTTAEAYVLLGRPGRYDGFLAALRRRNIAPTPNPRGYGNVNYYRVGDLDAFHRPVGSLSSEEVGALLWPGVNLSREALNGRLVNGVNHGILTRTERRNSNAGGWFYDEDAVRRLAALFDERRRGALILCSEARSMLRGCRGGIADYFKGRDVPVFYLLLDGGHDNGNYVRRRDVDRLVADEGPNGRRRSLADVGRELRLPAQMVTQLATIARSLTPDVDDDRSFTEAGIAYLELHRDNLIALMWALPTCEDEPNAKQWVPLSAAGCWLAVSEETLLHRAGQAGWSLCRYSGALYIARKDLVDDRDFAQSLRALVPMEYVAQCLGVSPSEATELAGNARWDVATCQVDDADVTLVDPGVVRSWLASLMSTGKLLTQRQAAKRLGLPVQRLQELGSRDIVRPRFVTTSLIAGNPHLFDADELDRILEKHTPPPGWATAAVAAQRVGRSPQAVRTRAGTAGVAMRDLHGVTWVDPTQVQDRDVDLTGKISGQDLLRRLGVPVERYWMRRLAQFARDGAIPGAVRHVASGAARATWWYPVDDELLASLAQRLTTLSTEAVRANRAGQAIVRGANPGIGVLSRPGRCREAAPSPARSA